MMILLMLLLAALFLLALWGGRRRLLRLEHLSRRRVAGGLLAAMAGILLLSMAYWGDILSRQSAAWITMGLYTVVSGYFFGFGLRLFGLRGEAGEAHYAYRSFWSEGAPGLIAGLLFLYGIYRTGLFSWGPFTGIGITSGLSLLGFAFWGWNVRIVPEFRRYGILLLDQFVAWERVVAFEWKGEETLQIDYENSRGGLTDFRTFIPAGERKKVERLLREKIQEHGEERLETTGESEA